MDNINKKGLKSYSDLLSDYEEFTNRIEELGSILEILYDYLDCNPILEYINSYYDLVTFHNSYFSLLYLVMDKLGALTKSNKNNVNNLYGAMKANRDKN